MTAIAVGISFGLGAYMYGNLAWWHAALLGLAFMAGYLVGLIIEEFV